ncbi:hypothetical protein ACOSP7_016437 [Xanthoceras sorbifolium]
MKGYLALYKEEQYHLPEFRMSGQPSNSRKIFNYMHLSFCFGVWKARWKILQNMHNYKFDKQVAIVTVSMNLHNFIRRETITNVEFQSYDENQDYVSEDEEPFVDLIMDESEMGVIRGRIARELLLR